MSLLSPGLYEELLKWRLGVATWRLRFKVLLGIFILGTSCYAISQSVVIPSFKEKIAGLNELISARDEEIASLRHENQKLYANNLHLQEMVAPFERRAQEMYPDLKAAAAIAELAKGLDTVRQLATRDVFRSINEELGHRLESNLKSLLAVHSTSQIKVVVGGREGEPNRPLLAKELVRILQAAGLTAEMGHFTTPFGIQKPILLYCNPDELPLAEAFVKALRPVLRNPEISGKSRPTQRPGELELYLSGIPEFSSDGSVLLR